MLLFRTRFFTRIISHCDSIRITAWSWFVIDWIVRYSTCWKYAHGTKETWTNQIRYIQTTQNYITTNSYIYDMYRCTWRKWSVFTVIMAPEPAPAPAPAPELHLLMWCMRVRDVWWFEWCSGAVPFCALCVSWRRDFERGFVWKTVAVGMVNRIIQRQKQALQDKNKYPVANVTNVMLNVQQKGLLTVRSCHVIH